MKYFSFFSSLFFSLSISLVDSFKCPNRSDQVPNEDVCMVAVSQAGVYANAAQGCSSFSGMPVKIQNLFENSFIYSYLLPGELNGVAPYIGIQRKNKIEWVYADGSTLIYQNWAPNEPNNESNTSACAIMDSQTAKWISTDCTSARPFVCSIDENTFHCPIGWVYFNETDFCYYLQNFSIATSGQWYGYWQPYDFPTAESLCKQNDSHLVSIHSDAENDFVMNLITSNVRHLEHVTPAPDPCQYQQAWIGYVGDGNINDHGSWTDGSPVDYLRTGFGVPGTYNWAVSNDYYCALSRRWDYYTWNYLTSRFVCKKPPKYFPTKEN